MGFRFKKFEINDKNSAHKVGTDGVLLGAWTNIEGVSNILDVGTGSGLVALMLAQRTEGSPAVKISAVEIDEESYSDSSENFNNSPWNNRLELIKSDFFEVDGMFDLIVSNPPFFIGDLNSPLEKRAKARQGDTLNYFSLLDFASSHLSPKGRLAIITDTRHENEIQKYAESVGLHLRRILYVSGIENKPPKRILWEWSRNNSSDVIEKTYICVRSFDSERSKEYSELTHEFYL